jgi:hypothetical protein
LAADGGFVDLDRPDLDDVRRQWRGGDEPLTNERLRPSWTALRSDGVVEEVDDKAIEWVAGGCVGYGAEEEGAELLEAE